MGGICGYTSSGSIVRTSKFGGSINDVTITEDNFMTYLFHLPDITDGSSEDSDATVENCLFWNGN